LISGLYLNIVFICGFLISIYFSIKYGQESYSKLQLSGAYRVGYKKFDSKDLNNDCSVYYPASDDYSGHFGIPFFEFGKKELDALKQIAAQRAPGWVNKYLFKLISGTWLNWTIPVYNNANMAM